MDDAQCAQWIKDVESLGPVKGQEPIDELAKLLNTNWHNRDIVMEHILSTAIHGAIDPYSQQRLSLLTPLLSEFHRYCNTPENRAREWNLLQSVVIINML